MKKSKRIVALLLSTMMAVQGSLVSYANNLNHTASGTQTSAGKPTASIGNGTWTLPTNTGYRFTITDIDGKVVSKTFNKDTGGYSLGSLDVVNTGFKHDGLRIGGSVLDTTAGNIHYMYYNDFLNIINAQSNPMPQWIDAGEHLYGEELRKWMMNGATTIQKGGSGGGNSSGGGGSKRPGSTGGSSGSSSSGGNKGSGSGSSTGTGNGSAAINPDTYVAEIRKSILNTPKLKVPTSMYFKENDSIINAYSSKNLALISKYLSEGKINSVRAADLKQLLITKVASLMQQALQVSKRESILDMFTMTAYASEGPGSTGPSAPANTGEKVDGKSPVITVGESQNLANNENYDPNVEGYAWAILCMTDASDNYVFQLDGAKTNKNEQGLNPGDVFIQNNYRLVIENTIQGKPQKAAAAGGTNYPSLVYGTAHNWAVFGSTVWLPWHRGGGQTFGNHQRYLTRHLQRALFTDAPWENSSGQVILRPSDVRDQWTIDEMMKNYDVGYGVHVYWPGESTNSIRTWDKPTYPDKPGPTEEPKTTDESTTYIEQNKNNMLKITKYYQRKEADGTITPLEYHNTINAPHTVYIMDEVEGNGYKLMDWFESKTDWQPPNDGDPEKNPYEQVKQKQFNTGITGTEEKLPHVIPPESDTKVLHILLEYTGKPVVTVIRVYENEDGGTDFVYTEDIDDNPYVVPTDTEYDYVETKITPNDPKDTESWNDSEGDSLGVVPEIEYPEDTRTIYIHYVKKPKSPDTQKIVLYENELSYNYSLKDLLKNRKLIEVYDNVPAAPFVWASCPGHPIIVGYDSDDDPIYRTFYCHTKTKGMNDMDWTVSVKDTFDQNTLPFIKQWTYISEMSATGITNGNGGEGRRAIVRPNATFLVIRDKQKDVVTLYPGKNDGIKGELSDLNLTEGYTSTDTRYKNKRETNATEKFYNTIRTQLDDSGSERHLEWWTLLTGTYGSHGKTGGYNTSPEGGHSVSDANAAYSKTDNFETRYFLGKAGKSEEEPKDTRSAWTKKFKYNIAYSRTSAGLSFYPYLKYSYYRKDSSSPEPVMVTSSNLSEFKVYNAIQTGVYKKNEININLDSTQWSTHARSMSFLKNAGVSDKKSVLPGGAIQNLDSGNKGDTQIGLTIWQTCLPDNQVQAVQEGFKVSETEAKEATNNLIESVKKAISGYGLVQWGQQGVYTDMKSLLSVAEELHENKNISFVSGRGGKTSADDKYYLRHDGEGSNRANFDCLDSRIENQYLYTIYSDTDGNVWVTKDGAELGRISKTQDVSGLLSNAELKLLDDNTKLITNYVAVIQRNSGTTRHGEKWHNEAFDGVSVLMTDVSFDVGYGGDSAKRTNVLDPLLTAPTQSKSDLYNFSDEDLVRSSVYVTTKTSSQAEQQKEGFLGILKGVSGMPDLETGLRDIQSMAYTKNFFIPNATVSDLN